MQFVSSVLDPVSSELVSGISGAKSEYKGLHANHLRAPASGAQPAGGGLHRLQRLRISQLRSSLRKPAASASISWSTLEPPLGLEGGSLFTPAPVATSMDVTPRAADPGLTVSPLPAAQPLDCSGPFSVTQRPTAALPTPPAHPPPPPPPPAVPTEAGPVLETPPSESPKRAARGDDIIQQLQSELAAVREHRDRLAAQQKERPELRRLKQRSPKRRAVAGSPAWDRAPSSPLFADGAARRPSVASHSTASHSEADPPGFPSPRRHVEAPSDAELPPLASFNEELASPRLQTPGMREEERGGSTPAGPKEHSGSVDGRVTVDRWRDGLPSPKNRRISFQDQAEVGTESGHHSEPPPQSPRSVRTRVAFVEPGHEHGSPVRRDSSPPRRDSNPPRRDPRRDIGSPQRRDSTSRRREISSPQREPTTSSSAAQSCSFRFPPDAGSPKHRTNTMTTEGFDSSSARQSPQKQVGSGSGRKGVDRRQSTEEHLLRFRFARSESECGDSPHSTSLPAPGRAPSPARQRRRSSGREMVRCGTDSSMDTSSPEGGRLGWGRAAPTITVTSETRKPKRLSWPGLQYVELHSYRSDDDGSLGRTTAVDGTASPMLRQGSVTVSRSDSALSASSMRQPRGVLRGARPRRTAAEAEDNARRLATVTLQAWLRGRRARLQTVVRRAVESICPQCGVAKERNSACLVCTDKQHSPRHQPGLGTFKRIRDAFRSGSTMTTTAPRAHPQAWEEVDIFRSCIAGDLESVQKVCEDDTSVLSQRDEDGATPLHVCLLRSRLFEKHRAIAVWIVQNHPDRARDSYHNSKFRGQVPLHFPIVHKDIELTNMVLAAAPQTVLSRAMGTFFSMSNQCYFGEWPLLFACSTNQPALVTRLLEVAAKKLGKGKNEMLEQRDRFGNTALHMCAIHNLPGMYRFVDGLCKMDPPLTFSQHGAAPENYEGYTPLALAAHLGRNEMLQYLVEKQCMDENWQYGAFRDRLVWLGELDRVEDGKGVLQILVERSHHQLLTHPILLALLQHKWNSVYGPRFRRRVGLSLLYNVAFVLAFLIDVREPESQLQLLTDCCQVVVMVGSVARLWKKTTGVRLGRVPVGTGAAESTASFTHSLLVLAGFALRTFGSGDVRDLGNATLAVASLLLWAGVLWFFLGFESTGPFVIMIWRMLGSDLKRFLLLFGTFLVGFSQAFYLLERSQTPRVFGRRLHSSFIALLGQVDLTGGSVSRQAEFLFPTFASLLLTVYVLLVTVLLLNLLIAMMSSTYSDILEESDKLWNLEWARIMYTMEREDQAASQRNKHSNRYWLEKQGKRYFCLPMVTGNDVREYWGGDEPDYDNELRHAKAVMTGERDEEEEYGYGYRRPSSPRRHSQLSGGFGLFFDGGQQRQGPPMMRDRRKSMDYRRNLIDANSSFLAH
eukprot:TRINITY_DN8560_c0_g1_i1.p1 TRINITY_DN8560_c0_g1~~TRINITY_DN8560_c0_g1_i1.p1  ORF type:complete len:1432 (+),score=447.08 TRINITY_DN8560_c0_g1_i1:75-4298(+)